ncbi:tRNA (guanine(10)-N(2))-dimethyltransferase [Candidatus Micrarchaeota archaeon]|nr:tRNA (guanine(10)-N(2))-dimethyltransferase [Candidatus Micrarchaeota archaeon]
MQEESILFKTKDSFYNKEMHLNRSISSLAVGAIEEKLSVLDAFSATGIRGLRYLKENKNIENITFLDIDENAIPLIKENLKKNSLSAEVLKDEINHHLFYNSYNFVELDPFGSPKPYIYHAIRSFRNTKGGYLSVTATDPAVLCGAHSSACFRIYHSAPLHTPFCHEPALRILIKNIIEPAAEFNFSAIPLFSLSHKHYFKVIFKLEKGAEKAVNSIKSLGYLSYCPKCGNIISSRLPEPACKECITSTKIGGPLYLGPLHSVPFLQKMQKLNSQRDYKHKEKIAKLLELMENENPFPPFYYYIPLLLKLHSLPNSRSMKDIILLLSASGFNVSKTHFSPVGIKTDAPLEEIIKSI